MDVAGGVNRRDFFRSAGAAGMLGLMPEGMLGQAAGQVPGHGNIVHEVAPAGPDTPPAETVNFAVCGMSHDHIYGMVDAITRGGGNSNVAA